jgi:positive regulator of sigma E activity
MDKEGIKIFAQLIGWILMIPVVLIIKPIFILLLWNWLMPLLFHLPVITWWQAVGISILSWLLFK